jgi:phosphomannomutase
MIGFAQDPDADRLAIVDENGTYIGEEYTLALAAMHMFAANPGPAAANLRLFVKKNSYPIVFMNYLSQRQLGHLF